MRHGDVRVMLKTPRSFQLRGFHWALSVHRSACYCLCRSFSLYRDETSLASGPSLAYIKSDPSPRYTEDQLHLGGSCVFGSTTIWMVLMIIMKQTQFRLYCRRYAEDIPKWISQSFFRVVCWFPFCLSQSVAFTVSECCVNLLRLSKNVSVP